MGADLVDDDQTAGPSDGGLASRRRWVQRAEGDRRSRRATLELVGGEGVVVLNDRRIPGSRSPSL